MAVDLTPPVYYEVFYNSSATFSACGWFRPDSVPAATHNYQSIWFMDNLSFGAYLMVRSTRLTATTMRMDVDHDGSIRINGPSLTVGQWTFFGFTRNGTALNLYWRTEGQSSLSSASGTTNGTPSVMSVLLLGERFPDATTTLDGAGAYFRLFESELSQSALLTESAATTAVAAEWADWPLANTTTAVDDVSGNNRDTTFNGGSQANASDPSIAIASGGPGPIARRRQPHQYGLIVR